MAQKVSLLDYMVLGAWAERTAINRNAEDLAEVEGTVSSLKAAVLRQGQEILWLRAVLGGLIAVLQEKSPLDNAELERAVQAVWNQLISPPSPSPAAPTMTDPYRDTPAQPTAPPDRLVRCPQCGREVPASKTNITENGEVCDACS
jgi:hypothetical protein